jgi:prolipoprotein diacylglyceryltransferase
LKYYILLIAGILSAILLYIWIRNKNNALWKELAVIYIVIIVGLFFGRLFSMFEYGLAGQKFGTVIEFYKTFKTWQSSRWYGALFAALLTLELFKAFRFLKIDYNSLISGICICTCLGLSIAKWGCFLDGHTGCGGTPTSLPWGVKYEWGTAISSVPMHPIQIYDSIVYFGLFGVLFIIRKNAQYILPIFLGGLAAYNLIVENIIRNDILFFNHRYSFAQIVYSTILILVVIKICISIYKSQYGRKESTSIS